MNIQEEGRLKFWRYEFKDESSIDRFIGDVTDDPNKETEPEYQLNSMAVWYRLNKEGNWINAEEFNKKIYIRIQTRRDDETAIDLWSEMLNK